MKKKNLSAILLISAIAILSSCANFFHSKEDVDCSSIFEANRKPDQQNPNRVTECKILPLKINKNVNCEVTGSDKVEDILKLYGHNKNKRKTILVAPLKSLEEMISYKHQLSYFLIKLKIKSHLDSDLFSELKHFPYKGIKCDIAGDRLIAWIGDDRVIASFEKGKLSYSLLIQN